MKVMVAMSGGVDSSVAAALVRDAGHDLAGVTMKLWGGDSDTGCCSVSDVDDARRVAHQLGIDHHVFNFSAEFERHVVDPYVSAWRDGSTPNPCIECNRHLKFDVLLARAELLGFDAVVTGHHARIVERDGRRRLARGADPAKDQSYVLYPLLGAALDSVMFPIGALTKVAVRKIAADLGLRTAGKAESQDVCFITKESGRASFLRERIPLRSGVVVDTAGALVGEVPAVELVTVGQRKGLGLAGGSAPRYVVDVDPQAARVVVGDRRDLLRADVELDQLVIAPTLELSPGRHVSAQCSAHGEPRGATVTSTADDEVHLRWDVPQPRVAPGQSVVLYDGDEVIAGGISR